ncbi:hypothetical protein ACJMK2_018120 [Sinanodonta woodiana]|uniref:NADP-dependent oxidoreductase domain-containing protein n=1 Tax=Sinanodonta woodiana TaxID=1069815 RepID=A0ABD3UDZ0_SINWO
MAADSKVAYNFLGKSGLKVSNICLGTLTFGMSKGSLAVYECSTQLDTERSHWILDRYVELGGNFLDTANTYTGGKSEEIIGDWLQKYAHAWDNAVPIEETLRTFDDLVRCGNIRYYGFSNVCGWQLQKIVDFAKYSGLNQPISLQQHYSLLCRQSEWEEFMVCKNEGIGVLPWSPLNGQVFLFGLLTGKFKRGEIPDKTKSRIGFIHTDETRALMCAPAWSNYAENEVYWNLLDVMEKIAVARGKSIPQVAIRWLLQQDVVSSVIIGATSLKQLDDNMGASAGWELSKEEMAELDAASPRMSYYPYEMIWKVNGPDRFNEFNHSIKI